MIKRGLVNLINITVYAFTACLSFACLSAIGIATLAGAFAVFAIISATLTILMKLSVV